MADTIQKKIIIKKCVIDGLSVSINFTYFRFAHFITFYEITRFSMNDNESKTE